MVMVMVNGAVDGERYKGRVVQTVHESNQKCVSIPKYKALQSGYTQDCQTQDSCQVQRERVKGIRYQARDRCLTGCFQHQKD